MHRLSAEKAGSSDARISYQVWARIWWCFDVLFLAAAVFSAILLVSELHV